MSVGFRVDRLLLETKAGSVDYEFTGPLTVLSGPVGAGKSTLFEFMRYATGGNARLAPPASTDVLSVRLELTVQSKRLALTRTLGPERGTVHVDDLSDGVERGTYPVDRRKGSEVETIGDLLLNELGLPEDASATSRARSARITFNSVWSFLYVEQREIDRSIAHNSDSVREPMRKATFELLYGFTDEALLRMQAQLLAADAKADDAERVESTVRRFLSETQTRSRDTCLVEYEAEISARDAAQSRLAALQSESTAVRGQVGVVRELLFAARAELEQLQQAHRSHDTQQIGRRQLLASLEERESQVVRGHSAATLLSPIGFVVCPRCSQSLKGREISPETCMLCLQDEPRNDANLLRRADYESERIAQQREEILALIRSGEEAAADLETNLVVARENLSSLEELLDQRTSAFVSPRLELYVEAASELARATARITELDQILQQWDRVRDLERISIAARELRERVRSEIRQAELRLAEYRESMLETLTANYRTMVAELGVPSVTDAHIDRRSYLPYANSLRFDQISSGGITTSLVTAYWLTLLATALREGQTSFPCFLIIDTPRKSIGTANSAMADEIYRQLSTLAEVYRGRLQVIVADNDAPAAYTRGWQVLRFDYESPTISTLAHPGPAKVTTLEFFEG